MLQKTVAWIFKGKFMQVFYMPTLFLPQVWVMAALFSFLAKLLICCIRSVHANIGICKGCLNCEILTLYNQHGPKPSPQAGTWHLKEEFYFYHSPLYHVSGTSCKFRRERKEDQSPMAITTSVIQVSSWFISSNRCSVWGYFFTTCSWR